MVVAAAGGVTLVLVMRQHLCYRCLCMLLAQPLLLFLRVLCSQDRGVGVRAAGVCWRLRLVRWPRLCDWLSCEVVIGG